MPSKNKPKSQVAVADAPTDLTPTERELELAVERAQSIVDDAKLEADLTVTSGDARVSDEQPTVEEGPYRVLPTTDYLPALLANAQEECTGFPPQVEVAKPAPTFLVVDPAQLLELGWSEHSAGKIALAVQKAQEAYLRLEGHGSYIPAPRLTGLRPSGSAVTSPSGNGQGTAPKSSGAAVNVNPPSGVTASGQIYTAAARGNAISIYDEATRKVNGERFAYSDAGWSDFNEWLQAKRAAGARVQLKFFSDAQKARITPAAETTPPQA
jgi:hypothetical protein